MARTLNQSFTTTLYTSGIWQKIRIGDHGIAVVGPQVPLVANHEL
jgi:hypothetical protein